MAIDYTIRRNDGFTQGLRGLQMIQALQNIGNVAQAQEEVSNYKTALQNALQSDNKKASLIDLVNQFPTQSQYTQRLLGNLQQQEYKADLQAALQDGTHKALSSMIKKHPLQTEKFKPMFETLNADQRKNEIVSIGSIYSALLNNDNEVAINSIDRQIEQKQKLNKDITGLQNIKEMIEKNPSNAKILAGVLLSSAMGADEFEKTFETIGEIKTPEQIKLEKRKIMADTELTQQEKNKIISEIRKNEAFVMKTNKDAEQVAVDTALKNVQLLKDRQNIGMPKLSKQAERAINEAVLSSVNSANLAAQYNNLVDEIEDQIKAAGTVAKGSEAFKSIFGVGDKATQLRQEYKRLRNTEVLKNLPPGPATDRDIEIAMAAYPVETDNPELIASFMRGMAKMQKYNSLYENIKAEWLNNNGNLANSKKDFKIDDKDVFKGKSFKEFISETLDFPNISIDEESVAEETDEDIYKKYGVQ